MAGAMIMTGTGAAMDGMLVTRVVAVITPRITGDITRVITPAITRIIILPRHRAGHAP